MSFLIHNCSFERLNDNIINLCAKFNCRKDKQIEKFFSKEVEDFDANMFAKSYGFVTLEDKPQLVCAFSVSNSILPVEIVPNKSRNKINRNVPYTKHKYQHPAVLVGQLAVFDDFSHLGISDELMDFIKSWFLDPTYKTACRYIIVDAVNNENVLNFYLRNNFCFLFDDLEEEMSCLGLDIEKEAKKTRLMYFDLIKLRDKLSNKIAP